MKHNLGSDKVFLGRSRGGELTFAKIQNGLIRGFSLYDLVEDSDGHNGLSNVAWLHNVKLESGQSFESGTALPESFKPEVSEDDAELLESAYEGNYISCDECGQAHDAESYQPNYIVYNECSVACRECVDAADLLREVNEPADFFKASDIRNMSVDSERFEEVETLFCDSSGFGAPNEPALTKNQAEERVAELLEEHGTLYAGLTDVGQFQVYVTLYKPVSKSEVA